MWFRRDPSLLFECSDMNTGFQFFDLFKKIFIPCMLWGTGTAIGEIPPYAISRAARLSGASNQEFLDIKEAKSRIPLLDRMKVWMINFLQKHGFIGVILMSAWPNAAFDLCGICCGHFLMPFWSFFLATFIGKALFKVNGQACFFITIFTEEYLSAVVSWVEHIIPESLDPCIRFGQKQCYIFLRDALHNVREKFKQQTASGEASPSSSTFSLSTIWNTMIMLIIFTFILSCVEQFAQAQATRMTVRQLEILKESSKESTESTKDKKE